LLYRTVGGGFELERVSALSKFSGGGFVAEIATLGAPKSGFAFGERSRSGGSEVFQGYRFFP